MQRVGLAVVGGAALLLIYRTLRKRLDAAESELATVSKAKDALAALARAQLDEKESALEGRRRPRRPSSSIGSSRHSRR